MYRGYRANMEKALDKTLPDVLMRPSYLKGSFEQSVKWMNKG